jgi:haloacetate dehalogenase
MNNSEFPTHGIDRRELFRQVAAVAAAASVAGFETAAAQQDAPAASGDTTRFFPGFTAAKVKTSGATINLVKGGDGPPLLLLHGAPMSHVSWRLVAPQLAKQYTVIAPDLRGYGDSSKSPDTPDHANYSKRNMALDHVEVMQHFGFSKFPVVGHDRGGRVAHRMVLDHPDKVTRVAVLDILPTYYLYTHVNIEFVQAYFHWFNYLRPAPGPENDLKVQNDAQKARATSEIQLEYLRTSATPENIHAMCEDYRAAASIDLKHDEADLAKKITAPLLTLWGEKGAMGKLYDVLAIWKERGTKVTGKGLPGGHNLQEDVPNEVLAELTAFLKA